MKSKLLTATALSTSLLLVGLADTTSVVTNAATISVAHVNEFSSANVVRLKDGKIQITWTQKNKNESVQIFWSSSTDKKGKLLKTVKGKQSIIISNPSPNARPYFELKTKKSSIKVAERLVPLKGTTNFRDLGGYKTSDGRMVKWGKLYRSDELAGLTDGDKKYLVKSGLKTVVDFRTDTEVFAKPDPVIEHVNEVRMQVGLDTGDMSAFNTMIASGDLSPLGKPGDILVQGNKAFVNDPAFRTLVQTVVNSKNLPLVLHCTAGKDRTGFGSAILLLMLEVPEKTVINDFLLSNTYRAAYNEQAINALKPVFKTQNDEEIFRALMEVRKEYIQAALNQIKTDYGTYQNYFVKFLKIDKNKQKQFQTMMLDK